MYSSSSGWDSPRREGSRVDHSYDHNYGESQGRGNGDDSGRGDGNGIGGAHISQRQLLQSERGERGSTRDFPTDATSHQQQPFSPSRL